MKSTKLHLAVASIMATGTLAFFTSQLSVAADMHQPGKGWDMFQSGSGEKVSSDNTGTAMNSAPGQGWDVFYSRVEGEVPITTRQQGSDIAPGKGWDIYHIGRGDHL